MELITIAVLILLIAGVVGSFLPMVPGALFSLTAVLVYFFQSPEVSLLFTVLGVLTALMALLFDWFAGTIAAKYGGASTKTSLFAGVAGFIGFVVTLGNPVGLLVAVMGTVFIREYLIHGKGGESLRSAFYATLGVLGSGIIQGMLTASVLLAFLITLAF
jgi:uncharacterized protein YqgC (DUF456 family)